MNKSSYQQHDTFKIGEDQLLRFFHKPKAAMFVECTKAGEVLFSTLETREKLSAELHKVEHFFKIMLTNESAIELRIAKRWLLLPKTLSYQNETSYLLATTFLLSGTPEFRWQLTFAATKKLSWK